MVQLKTLLAELKIDVQPGCPADPSIAAVTDRSDRCGPETLFVAVRGTRADGHDFLAQAAAAGCRAALVEREKIATPAGMTLLRVGNGRRALALIAQRLAGDPSRHMRVAGVTGTNGKTTVIYLLEAILRAAGLKTGVIGTIQYRWGDTVEDAPQTTPSPTELADLMARMRADGVEAVAMEVSSHAIDQHRVDGVAFDAAALTNITQDHLDYHVSMEAYQRAKRRLFTEVVPENPGGVSVLNLDDPAGRAFTADLPVDTLLGYSFHRTGADFRVEQLLVHSRGMVLDLIVRDRRMQIQTPMRGLFNAINCLTAVGLATAMDLPMEAVVAGCANMRGAPGRFEFIESDRPFRVIVDYAHTPDALVQVLLNARAWAKRRLIVVFGCGGDRDPDKRAPMGEAAARVADLAIVTNDNPRGEDPAAIARAIVEGIDRCGVSYRLELDRRKAIRRAIALARPGDVVLVAGKGHEDYQILGPERIHFDDREEVRGALEKTNSK